MDKCLWIGAGYPVLLGAIAVLWKVYQAALKGRRSSELLLLEEKDRRLRELEAFLKIVEARAGGPNGGKSH